MYSTHSASLTLPHPSNQCMTLTALLSTPSAHNFLVGSCNIKPSSNSSLPSNCVTLVNFNEEKNKLSAVRSYDFKDKGEVVTLESISSLKGGVLASTRSCDGKHADKPYQACVYVFPNVPEEGLDPDDLSDDDDDDDDVNNSSSSGGGGGHGNSAGVIKSGGHNDLHHSTTPQAKAEDVAELPRQKLPIHSALAGNGGTWSEDGRVVLGDSESLSVFDLRAQKSVNDGNVSSSLSFFKCALDPHHPELVGCVSGTSLLLYDLRNPISERGAAIAIEGAHLYGIRDLDFNPNRPHFLSTGGEDGLVKFWDLRSGGKRQKEGSASSYSLPSGSSNTRDDSLCKVLEGHSHWVSAVRYNRFHDQLLASAGTDTAVNLWRVSSISSAPLVDLSAHGGGGGGGGTTRPSVRTTVVVVVEEEEGTRRTLGSRTSTDTRRAFMAWLGARATPGSSRASAMMGASFLTM